MNRRFLVVSLAAALPGVAFLGASPQKTRTPQSTITLAVASGKIEVTLPEEHMRLSTEELLGWVESSAATVAQYYGRFPVPHLLLRIRHGGGQRIRGGWTFAKDGGLILVTVGENAGVGELKDDWVLVHEMIHLGFPSMEDKHHWLEEGISTYVEAIARAQAGKLSAEDVWKEFVRDMPQGQPEDGDRGLDNTPTWGRTYWGGAIFCLVADVRIREQTRNRKSLRDALRGILNGGGNINEDWSIDRALVVGDRATGTSVLRTLYAEMSDKPVTVDLNSVWQTLGVELRDGKIVFNDQASEAAIRRAMTAAEPAAPNRR